MTFAAIVKDGTGAGRKRPLKPKQAWWTCGCGEAKPGYLASCIACGTRRPETR